MEIDDVDPVALTEDVTLHLRVPTPGLVAEMDAGLQQLLHSHDSHAVLLPIGCRHLRGARRRRWVTRRCSSVSRIVRSAGGGSNVQSRPSPPERPPAARAPYGR